MDVAPEVLADAPALSTRPARRSASASDARRAAARIKRKARSAVVSSSTPGVLHTAMPALRTRRRRRCCRSPRPRWRRPAAGRRRPRRSTSASMRSVSRQTIASTRRPRRTARRAVKGWSSSRCTSSCPAATSGSSPPSGSWRVTRTRATGGQQRRRRLLRTCRTLRSRTESVRHWRGVPDCQVEADGELRARWRQPVAPGPAHQRPALGLEQVVPPAHAPQPVEGGGVALGVGHPVVTLQAPVDVAAADDAAAGRAPPGPRPGARRCSGCGG